MPVIQTMLFCSCQSRDLEPYARKSFQKTRSSSSKQTIIEIWFFYPGWINFFVVRGSVAQPFENTVERQALTPKVNRLFYNVYVPQALQWCHSQAVTVLKTKNNGIFFIQNIFFAPAPSSADSVQAPKCYHQEANCKIKQNKYPCPLRFRAIAEKFARSFHFHCVDHGLVAVLKVLLVTEII